MDSVNHHYIPQLYLKGFTASNGKLQIFDKSLGHFKKDKQTPKTVFFGKHRNTIEFKGIKTDKIERLYSDIDSGFGIFFELIRAGISHDGMISKEGIYLLKMFIAIQFWRMPLVDSFAKNQVLNMDLNRYGKRITINGVPIGENEKIRELLDNDKGFQHYFRSFFLPVLMFDFRVHQHDYKCWKLHIVSEDSPGWDNILTSDNPIVVENLAEMFAFNTKLIFPLSKTQIVTYSPQSSDRKILPPIFSTKLSMLMYAQSQQYLAGANRNYIQKIIDFNDEMYGNEGASKLRNELFEFI